MVPWLICMLVFGAWRAVAFIFTAVVNDMIFAYNIIMCLFWISFTVMNAIGWAATYSLYLELSDLTKLEDMAKLRVTYSNPLCRNSYVSMISQPFSYVDGHYDIFGDPIYGWIQTNYSPQYNVYSTNTVPVVIN